MTIFKDYSSKKIEFLFSFWISKTINLGLKSSKCGLDIGMVSKCLDKYANKVQL